MTTMHPAARAPHFRVWAALLVCAGCGMAFGAAGDWLDALAPPSAYAAFPRKVEKTATYVCADFDVEVYSQRNGPDTCQRVMMAVPHGLRGKAPCVVVPFYFPEAMLGFDPANGSCTSARAPAGTNLTYYAAISYMADLARRGYVTLSADAAHVTYRTDATNCVAQNSFALWRQFAERLHKDWPDWCGMGKLVFDTRLLVDMAEADGRVDASRIGMIGHSLGGKMAFYAGLTDKRVKAVVASDFGLGWTQTNWGDAWYWGGKLAALRASGASNVDVLSRSDGKPFCLLAGKYDDADSGRLMRGAAGYERAPERLVFVHHGTGHRPPPEATLRGYRFLDAFLKRPIPPTNQP